MKIVKRILLSLLILVVVALIIGLFFLRKIQTEAIPDYNKDIAFENISSPVNILRDTFGIPHIFAQNEADLYRAVGIAMAQDRLWQMDLLRRVTQGRLSEILGKDMVKTDLLMRALRIQEKSEKILAASSPEIKAALDHFSEGVNFYIENNPLPPEYRILGYQPEAWQPVHSINLIGYMSWDLTSGWNTELLLYKLRKKISDEQIRELIPDVKNQPTAIFPDFSSDKISLSETLLSAEVKLSEMGIEIFNGSNNWAVSGEKSTSGKPLLANDMHLGLFAPGIWYQMQQSVPGKVNVTGLVLPGQPFVIAGHNDSIAWGMTNVMVDDLDFYTEKINADSTKYLLDGEWKNLLIKKEEIKTKEGETIEKTLRFTHRGPLVNSFKNDKETPLSIRWLGNEMSNEIRTVFLLNRAHNWADFRDAVKTFKSVSQNIVYADVAGNIGLQTSAGVPLRAGNGIQIYPGDSSKYDWTGLVPFEELPFEFNPPRGYVSSANNKTVSNNYPYYISNWFLRPNRIDRIREMLEEKEKLSISDFQKMHRDQKSKQAERMVPVFVSALESKTKWNSEEQQIISNLKNWNLVLTKESQQAAVYEILYRKTCENLIKDDVSEELFTKIMGQRTIVQNLLINVLENKNSKWPDNKNTPEIESLNDIIIQSFSETLSELKTLLGENTEQWQWGKIHTFTISHPLGVVKMLDKVFHLNRGPFELGGSYHTVCPYSYSYNNLYKINHGASHRHIYDVSNWDASKTVIPTGTSGIPASPFYLDQTNLYIKNQYHSDPFSFDEVEKSARYKMKIYSK